MHFLLLHRCWHGPHHGGASCCRSCQLPCQVCLHHLVTCWLLCSVITHACAAAEATDLASAGDTCMHCCKRCCCKGKIGCCYIACAYTLHWCQDDSSSMFPRGSCMHTLTHVGSSDQHCQNVVLLTWCTHSFCSILVLVALACQGYT